MKYRGVTITNSLEHVDWTDNPVQVILCEACGHAGCALGNYVDVSRLDSYVLWSPSQIGEEMPSFLRKFGTLAIPVAIWSTWPGVPPFSTLPAVSE